MATKKIQMLDYNIKQSENSDTLDGKHASDFASASDMTTAKSNIGELQTKVGDKSVSSQISTAIASKADTDHTHTKSEVGLGNVDNTADADKSVKYATSAGSAASVTGVVGIEHGGTGGSDRVSAITALIAGGGTETDANIVAPGVYVLNTSTGKNLPSEEGYYIVYVMRYDTADLACGQIAINLGSNTLYHRVYVTGIWREWITEANSVVEHFASCYGATNQPTNDLLLINTNYSFGTSNYDMSFGTEDASTLKNSPVTSGPFYGYRKVYQIYVSGANNYKTIVELHEAWPKRGRVWKREYDPNTGWLDYWSYSFTNNDTIPIANGGTGATTAAGALAALGGLSQTLTGIELGMNLNDSSNFGGYVDFHFNGNTSDYTSRIIETQSGRLNVSGHFDVHGWLQCWDGFYVAGGGFYIGANNGSTYGTSLPAAGHAGRVFFKKA